MGQTNYNKISYLALELEEEKVFSKKTMESFLNCYSKKKSDYFEIEKFIEEPSMELFLKYFIKNEYDEGDS